MTRGASMIWGGEVRDEELTAQRERLERITKEMEPNCTVEFVPSGTNGAIRFGITNKISGEVLVASQCQLAISLAEKSDNQLRKLIAILSAGRIRWCRAVLFRSDVR
jgi:hypothetical protein